MLTIDFSNNTIDIFFIVGDNTCIINNTQA